VAAQLSERRPESVLVVVYTSNDEILLLQRSDNPLYWQSITGALEADELPISAAHRELFEETGLQLSLVDHQKSTQYPIAKEWLSRYPTWATVNTEHLFSACVESPMDIKLDPGEHLDARWVNASEAVALVFSQTNREAIQSIVLES